MLDLFMGMDLARRRTEELLTYDDHARGRGRGPRGTRSRLVRAVSILRARAAGGAAERSCATPAASHRRMELGRRRAS